MIQSLTTINPNGIELTEGRFGGKATPSYAFSLDSIKGKTFNFEPGINVIIGANGCGKTTLLNIIRCLTFCDGVFYSSTSEEREHWKLNASNSYDKMYWHLTEMKAQYSLATFNLRKSSEIHSVDGIADFIQTLGGARRSEGEGLMDAINMMMMVHRYGPESLHTKDKSQWPKEDENGLLPHHYFKKTVLAELKKSAKSDNDAWKPMWVKMIDYYARNDLPKGGEDHKYAGFTFLMDEPDKGMDVYNVEKLYSFLVNCPAYCQHIVVLHNIGMIHKLKEWGGVHFIEMTEGYLEKVENFFR